MPDDTAKSLARMEAATELARQKSAEKEESQRGKREISLLMREKNRLRRRERKADRELATFLGVAAGIVGWVGVGAGLAALLGPGLVATVAAGAAGAGALVIGGFGVKWGSKRLLHFMSSMREQKRESQTVGV